MIGWLGISSFRGLDCLCRICGFCLQWWCLVCGWFLGYAFGFVLIVTLDVWWFGT